MAKGYSKLNMAKKTTTTDDELIPLVGELVPMNTEANALIIVSPLENQLIALEAEADLVNITNKSSYENALLVTAKLRKYSSGANKTRLAFTAPVRTMLDTIKSRVDGWIDRSNAKLQIVEDKVNAEALKIAAAAKAERIRRMDLLHANGWSVTGEFYVCGAYRIMLDQIDTATEQSLALWVQQGAQEKAKIAADKLAQDAKTAELEAREAALRVAESDMAEFQKWKALQNPPVVINEIPVFVPPAMSPSKQFDEPPVIIFNENGGYPFQHIATPPLITEDPIAPKAPEYTAAAIVTSASDYDELTNATKQAFNDGIDAVCTHFINNQAKLEKQSWVSLWQTLKL